MGELLRCSKCKLFKDPEEFHTDNRVSRGKQYSCKPCTKEMRSTPEAMARDSERQKQSRSDMTPEEREAVSRKRSVQSKAYRDARTPDEIAQQKEYNRLWYENNKDRVVELNRKNFLRRNYGLTDEEVLLMFSNQEGLCAICSRPICMCKKLPKCNTRAHIDHDHETGEVRNLLCVNCNIGLGNFRDSLHLLKNAAEYLSSHKSNSISTEENAKSDQRQRHTEGS